MVLYTFHIGLLVSTLKIGRSLTYRHCLTYLIKKSLQKIGYRCLLWACTSHIDAYILILVEVVAGTHTGVHGTGDLQCVSGEGETGSSSVFFFSLAAPLKPWITSYRWIFASVWCNARVIAKEDMWSVMAGRTPATTFFIWSLEVWAAVSRASILFCKRCKLPKAWFNFLD